MSTYGWTGVFYIKSAPANSTFPAQTCPDGLTRYVMLGNAQGRGLSQHVPEGT